MDPYRPTSPFNHTFLNPSSAYNDQMEEDDNVRAPASSPEQDPMEEDLSFNFNQLTFNPSQEVVPSEDVLVNNLQQMAIDDPPYRETHIIGGGISTNYEDLRVSCIHLIPNRNSDLPNANLEIVAQLRTLNEEERERAMRTCFFNMDNYHHTETVPKQFAFTLIVNGEFISSYPMEVTMPFEETLAIFVHAGDNGIPEIRCLNCRVIN